MPLAYPKPTPRCVERRARHRAEATAAQAVARVVRKRDGGKCQCCGKPGSHQHHVTYRSHGGQNVPDNLVTLCVTCHQDVHAHLVTPRRTARGWRFIKE